MSNVTEVEVNLWWYETTLFSQWFKILTVVVMPVANVIGIILNLISFLIIQLDSSSLKPLFRYNNIYIYLKYLFMLDVISNVAGLVFSFIMSNTFNSTRSAENVIMIYIILFPITNLTYFGQNVLNLFMTVEKLKCFYKQLDKSVCALRNSYPHITICVVLFVCFVIDLPCFFYFEPQNQVLIYNDTYNFSFADFKTSQFISSPAGQIIVMTQLVLRDIGSFLLMALLNLLLVYKLDIYIRNRRKILAARGISVVMQSNPNQQNSTQSQINDVNANNTTLNTTGMTDTKSKSGTGGQSKTKSRTSRGKTSLDTRVIFMVLILCISTLIKNVLTFAAVYYSMFKTDSNSLALNKLQANLLTSFSMYCIYINTTVNFLIIYAFDKNFKASFDRIICRKKTK